MATTFSNNDTGTIAYGGESNDTATETLDSTVGTVSVAPSATFTQTGSRSLAFDLSGNGNKAVVRADVGPSRDTLSLTVLSFAAALSAAPTAEACVFGGDTSTSGGTGGVLAHSYVRIGTDRKIYLYDKAGSPIVGGVSTSTLPTAAPMREVVISFDGLTNPANTWIKMYMDGVEELAFASGQPIGNIFNAADYFYWGDSCATGTNRGSILYLDDFISRFSATQTEAPHLTQYPRVRVAGSVTADSQATYNAWSPTPAGADHYNRITTNESPTTTFLQDAVLGDKDTWKSSTANPMPGGATVIKAQLRQVAKLGGVGKTSLDMLFGLVGAVQSQTSLIGSISTSYTARIAARLLEASSALPVFADAAANTCEWGVTNPGSGTANSTITFSPGPEWVYYTALLPLGTAPSSGSVVDTSVVGTSTDAVVI